MNLSQMMAKELAGELDQIAGYGCMKDYLDVVLNGDESNGAHVQTQSKGVRVILSTTTDNDITIAIDTAKSSVTVSQTLPNGDTENGESLLCQDTVEDVKDYVRQFVKR